LVRDNRGEQSLNEVKAWGLPVNRSFERTPDPRHGRLPRDDERHHFVVPKGFSGGSD
jgi:hypothetical protein